MYKHAVTPRGMLPPCARARRCTSRAAHAREQGALRESGHGAAGGVAHGPLASDLMRAYER